MKLVIAFCIGLLLCSCGEPPRAPEISVKESTLSSDSRITVKRIATFRDRFQHVTHEREILIITDTKTGKEFIGINGVGITETSVVFDGKVSQPIEQ